MPELSRALSRIQYNPVGVVVAKYAEPIFDKDVRALVFDGSYELSNAGAYGINDLDIVRYTFSGALAAKNIDEQTDPETLVALGEKYLGNFLPIKGVRREAYVSRYFRHGLCAYTPFHHELMTQVQGQLSTCPGLFLVGDYIRGAAIEACFRSAKDMSMSLSELIQGRARVTELEPEARIRAA
jgi:oxygen-dependent protoporphyrinogen oxidase